MPSSFKIMDQIPFPFHVSFIRIIVGFGIEDSEIDQAIVFGHHRDRARAGKTRCIPGGSVGRDNVPCIPGPSRENLDDQGKRRKPIRILGHLTVELFNVRNLVQFVVRNIKQPLLRLYHLIKFPAQFLGLRRL